MMRSDARKINRRKRAANGDGTLYHRKDGRWKIAYSVDGRRHRFASWTRVLITASILLAFWLVLPGSR